MDTDIKLIDLRKENLNNVKEAIRLASALGAKNFKLFVNPMFVRNGLVSPRIVPMSIEAPPSSQFLLSLVDLKNLKKTVDFAKKMLVDDGEATVEEKEILVVIPAPVAEAAAPVVAPVIELEKLSTQAEEPPTTLAEPEDEEVQEEESSEENSEETEEPTDSEDVIDLSELPAENDKIPTATSKKRKSKKGTSGKKSE